MQNHSWVSEFPGSITVCDNDGTILEMNKNAAEVFIKDGGIALLGKNVLDCHPEPARSKLLSLLETHQNNIYFTEKHGVKKLIFQAPWYENGLPQGMVELSIQLPIDIPTFKRD
jgi:transcriptional regulator with PAS, ATPase and Fis domain